MSLWAFQEKLDALGHFYTRYQNIDQLKFHFNQQLDKLVASGFIEFKPDKGDAAAAGGNTYNATLTGSGAIAQGGGTAVGERGVYVGDNAGTIVTGTQIVAHYHAAISGRLTQEEIARQVAGYLRWLRSRTESIELRGIERAGGAPVVLLPLATAYVPLRAKWMRGGTDVALNEVLGLGHRLVIIGGPGSGKTTVLLHMAWALASSLLNGQPEPARSRLGLSIEPNELPLPLFVPLASFARYRRNLAGNAPARERTLAYFISHHLISKQADFDLPADFFVQLLQDGQDVLLLLDGLDEVANEDERAEVRQSVEDLASGREALRVVVTCRTIAYRSGRTALAADFREIAVQPLDPEQHIAPMVRQAYACIYPHDAALRAERANDLLGGIQRLEAERRARLGEQAEALVDSPLMVRLLLIVHFNNRRLPDERADLFDKAINALLQVDYGLEQSVINDLSADWKLFRDMAQQLAFHLHQQGRDQGREIEEPALKKALREEVEFKPRLDDFLGHARQRGSVLEERGGAYRFIHLAFQEFLVARYLSEVTGREEPRGHPRLPRRSAGRSLVARADPAAGRLPGRQCRQVGARFPRRARQGRRNVERAVRRRRVGGDGGAGMARQRRADPNGLRPAHRRTAERYERAGGFPADPARPRRRYAGAIGRPALRPPTLLPARRRRARLRARSRRPRARDRHARKQRRSGSRSSSAPKSPTTKSTISLRRPPSSTSRGIPSPSPNSEPSSKRRSSRSAMLMPCATPTADPCVTSVGMRPWRIATG